uniref:C2H2-type domain-containing protein n=1 Tax=Steinernema glaseri TaxID=37863 RepID=A0A1I8AA00_9BILA
MNPSSAAHGASSDHDKFLRQSQDVKNNLINLLESQEKLRRMMMNYSNEIIHGPSITAMNNREISPQRESNDEEKEGSSEEDEISSVSSVSSEEEADLDNDGLSVIEEGASHPEALGQAEKRKLRIVRDVPNSEKMSIWKCAVCGKQIKGNWRKRQGHIQAHEGLKVSCPVAECSVIVGDTNLRKHLKRKHKMACNALPSREKALLQKELDRNNEVAMNYEMKYFPPTSLISFSDTTGKDPVKPFCKKCRIRCTQLQGRRNHVAIELKLKLNCPVRGCSHRGRHGAIKAHLRRKHGKQLRDLNGTERKCFDNARQKLYKKVDNVMHQFFSQ